MLLHFAPLQGYTEAHYRRIHHTVCGGVDAYYTPFIRLEHGQIRKKDLREALPEHNDGVPVVPQVIAADVEELRPLIDQLVAVGHRRIDVNMGCPFPLQTRLGRGSGLLPHPDRVEAILRLMADLTASDGLDFSIKMRLGQESADEAFALLPALCATPLRHVTLHPRVGRDQYKGELDVESFERFYEECTHPLVFNGLVTTPQQIRDLQQRYPRLAGVMIGRGLLSRPTLAAEYVSGQELPIAEVQRRVLEMHRLLFAHYQTAIEGGEAQLVQKMHAFWDYLEPLFGHRAVKHVLKSGSLRRYREAVSGLSL